MQQSTFFRRWGKTALNVMVLNTVAEFTEAELWKEGLQQGNQRWDLWHRMACEWLWSPRNDGQQRARMPQDGVLEPEGTKGSGKKRWKWYRGVRNSHRFGTPGTRVTSSPHDQTKEPLSSRPSYKGGELSGDRPWERNVGFGSVKLLVTFR